MDYPVARVPRPLPRLFAALRRRCDHHLRPVLAWAGGGEKRPGIEAIYIGGWATSAKGSADEDPGPDLASYPLSQVPTEAAGVVRALLTADRNQRFARTRMTDAERASHARGRLPAIHHR